ncbi:hypothetical protein BH10PSE7_BH10PSE7_38250 [soil metagenome]
MKRFIMSAVSLAALAASGIAYAEDPAATTTQPPAVGTETQNSQQPALPDANATQPPAQPDATAQQPAQTQPDATTAEQPAQTQPDATTAEQPAQKQPDATTAEQPAPAQPDATQSTQTQPDATATQQSTAVQPPAIPGKPITMTDMDPAKATLASTWIGSSVFSAANENVGDINDIVLSSDGAVKAVIIGVGGFLGMGEKDVAVPLDQITASKDENGNVKLMINATRADLDATPAFDRTHFTVGTVQQ